MATANFTTTDISTIYAIDIDYEEAFEDSIENMRSFLDNEYDGKFVENYERGQIGHIYFDAGHMQVRLDVSLRSGYYEGANYDVSVSWSDCWGDMGDMSIECLDDEDSIDFVAEAMYNMCIYERGMSKMQAPNQMKKVRKVIDEELAKLEKLLAECSDHVLDRIGTFSNGSALYERK